MKRLIFIRQYNRRLWALRAQAEWRSARHGLAVYGIVSGLLLLAITLLLLVASILQADIPILPVIVWPFDILLVAYLGCGP